MIPYIKKVAERVSPALTEDGEIKNTLEPVFTLVGKNDTYTMWFDHLDPIVFKLTKYPDFKLLYWIARNLSNNKYKIVLNLSVKEDISKELKGMSLSAIDRSIRNLKSSKIIFPYGSPRCASFLVNPVYLWRGERNERKKACNEFLQAIWESNLPDKEKQEIIQRQNYKEAISFKYDFSKVKAAS
jgi:hypothetical protein